MRYVHGMNLVVASTMITLLLCTMLGGCKDGKTGSSPHMDTRRDGSDRVDIDELCSQKDCWARLDRLQDGLGRFIIAQSVDPETSINTKEEFVMVTGVDEADITGEKVCGGPVTYFRQVTIAELEWLDKYDRVSPPLCYFECRESLEDDGEYVYMLIVNGVTIRERKDSEACKERLATIDDLRRLRGTTTGGYGDHSKNR